MTAERIFDVLGHFKRYEKIGLVCPHRQFISSIFVLEGVEFPPVIWS